MLAPATRALLEAAGIREGMRVLDLGAGIGDVAFVIADLVGAAGEVIGLELAGSAVAIATRRAEERGLSNVRFVQGDIREPASGGPFDALTCRFVLMYLEDPAAVLRTQAAALRDGAVVAPIELDVSTARSMPETPLVTQVLVLAREGLARAGADTALGPRLWQALLAAGVSPRGMAGAQPCFGPDDRRGPKLLAAVVRTLLPVIERFDPAAGEDVQIDTLEDRLAAELAAAAAVWAHPALYCAWGEACAAR